MNVYISNPERKKERTDAGADQREIYIAGLSKLSTRADLEQLFGQFGAIKEIRIATEGDGSAKGYAFIEFEQEVSAFSVRLARVLIGSAHKVVSFPGVEYE